MTLNYNRTFDEFKSMLDHIPHFASFTHKCTPKYLLEQHIMFSDTMDLSKVRMYLAMDYEVIFKYKYGFISLIKRPEVCMPLYYYNLKYSFEEVLPDLQVCSKQDIFNYCYWAKNRGNTMYPHNRSIVLVSLTSETFN